MRSTKQVRFQQLESEEKEEKDDDIPPAVTEKPGTGKKASNVQLAAVHNPIHGERTAPQTDRAPQLESGEEEEEKEDIAEQTHPKHKTGFHRKVSIINADPVNNPMHANSGSQRAGDDSELNNNEAGGETAEASAQAGEHTDTAQGVGRPAPEAPPVRLRQSHSEAWLLHAIRRHPLQTFAEARHLAEINVLLLPDQLDDDDEWCRAKDEAFAAVKPCSVTVARRLCLWRD